MAGLFADLCEGFSVAFGAISPVSAFLVFGGGVVAGLLIAAALRDSFFAADDMEDDCKI